jgi:glycosyl transferase, family 25
MIPVIVLNLARSTTRRAQIAARLDSLSIKHRFFEAIDGRQLSPQDRERLAPPSALLFDRPLTAGEIGCAATHLAVIREIAEGADQFVCIIEDDAIVSADIALFLEPAAISALPRFDVMRFVSDPLRWRFPAWEIGRIHDRGVCTMSRPGFGTQGQIYSRDGARKIASQVSVVRAPIDFALYHDCHVSGLRVLEIRPEVIQHDLQLIDRTLQSLSEVGARSSADHDDTAGRWKRKIWRWRRKSMAARAFVRLRGVKGVLQLIFGWRPGSYFR